MEIKNFTITKRDGTKDRFSLDKILGAITKAFETVDAPADLGTVSKVISHLDIKENMSQFDIQHELEHILLQYANLDSCKHDRRHENPGRPKATRFCAALPDRRVVTLLREIGRRLKSYIDKPLQLLTCYYLAMFALLKTESWYGKIEHYWRILVKYIKGFRIPALRTLQDAIAKYSNWKEKTKRYVFTACEKFKFKAWDALQSMIEKLLPQLEPALNRI